MKPHYRMRDKICPASKIITPSFFKQNLPKLEPDMHKGNLGKVGIVGGEPGMAGATILAGISALRANTGLVKIFTHPSHAHLLMLHYPELIVKSIKHGLDIEELKHNKYSLLVGSGLGQSSWAQALLLQILQVTMPMVIDADGLNLLAKHTTYKNNWILTPHPKEAARLLSCSVQDVLQDCFAAAFNLQKKYGGVVVLKGAGTIIVNKDTVYVCPYAVPGLATAGMGDVLSGIIASFLAQGLKLLSAAACGVWLHNQAGMLLAKDGHRGIIASDMFMAIKTVLNKCTKDL